MKVALAHDWLVSMGGAENVLEEMSILYPKADIYTLFSDFNTLQNTEFRDKTIINSSLQKFPMIQKLYRKLPNLFPMAIEEFDFSNYDLVLSSSHAVAKGILTDAKTCHVCYMHTPMRYIWDLTFEYLNQSDANMFVKFYMRMVFHNLRIWDSISSSRPDFIIANSEFIRKRIQKVYRRDAIVIHPPVSLSEKVYTDKKNYYVTASRHVPYKNIPLIAEAFAQMPDKRLVILGDGPDSKKVQKICSYAKNIEYLGYQKREVLMDTIGYAKAFVFAAEEDFGILPVEAQSLGTPIIAYNAGGARETVVDQKTGIFFDNQNIESIKKAVNSFEQKEDQFDPTVIAQHCQQFSQKEFKHKLDQSIQNMYQQFINIRG